MPPSVTTEAGPPPVASTTTTRDEGLRNPQNTSNPSAAEPSTSSRSAPPGEPSSAPKRGGPSAAPEGMLDGGDLEPNLNVLKGLFPLRRPAHFVSGLGDALTATASGVVIGLGAFVASPILMAKEQGVKGFFKGAGLGTAALVLAPIAGATVGTTQLVRGLINTPHSCISAAAGKKWDKDTREWIRVNGSDLMIDPEAAAPSDAQGKKKTSFMGMEIAGLLGPREDDDFYELLGVQREARPEEIKKAYYVKARQLHPDKNPDDEEAHLKFQKLGEAYQVLSDPALRQKYDEGGKAALDMNLDLDPGLFFTMLFGEGTFAAWLGEPSLAYMFREGMASGNVPLFSFKAERWATLREMRLEIGYRDMLKRWMDGDPDGFRAAVRAEAKKCAQSSFGPDILEAFAVSMKVQVRAVQGGALGKFKGFFKERSLKMGRRLELLSSGWRAFKVGRKSEEIEALVRNLEQVRKQHATTSATPQSPEATADAKTTTTTSAAAEAAAEVPGGTVRAGESEPGPGPSSSEASAEAPPPALLSEEFQRLHEELLRARAKQEEELMPRVLEAAWNFHRMDIDRVARHVGKRLLVLDPEFRTLRDEDRTRIKRARARALETVCAIFLEEAWAVTGRPGPEAEALAEAEAAETATSEMSPGPGSTRVGPAAAPAPAANDPRRDKLPACIRTGAAAKAAMERAFMRVVMHREGEGQTEAEEAQGEGPGEASPSSEPEPATQA